MYVYYTTSINLIEIFWKSLFYNKHNLIIEEKRSQKEYVMKHVFKII